MKFCPQHIGLFFTEEHIHHARKYRKLKELAPVWDLLLSEPKEDLDNLSIAHLAALRYRFNNDAQAGEQAIALMRQINLRDREAGTGVRRLLAIGQCLEMTRDHPAFNSEGKRQLRNFADQVMGINQTNNNGALLDTLWQGTLKIAAGVILENEEFFREGVNTYYYAIDSHIHPEGMMIALLKQQERGGYGRQLCGIAALTLMAEAATHAGVNLWQYQNRGVSLATGFAYLLYYYYYPAKWQWDDETLTKEHTKKLFHEHGAFTEIMNWRAQPRGIALLLEEQRPMFDAYKGGFTSLTHFYIRKRRGLFG